MLEYISLSHANFEGETASLITLPMTRQKLNTSSLSGMKSIFCKQAPVNGVGDKEDSWIKAESCRNRVCNLEEQRLFFLPSSKNITNLNAEQRQRSEKRQQEARNGMLGPSNSLHFIAI